MKKNSEGKGRIGVEIVKIIVSGRELGWFWERKTLHSELKQFCIFCFAWVGGGGGG